MRVERKVTYKKRLGVLDSAQYLIAIIIAICFGIGLIPFYYDEVFVVLISLIIVQIIISFVRLRLLNVIIEVFLLIISIIAIIPFIGYLFRIIGLLASLLEMLSFKNYIMYKNIEIRTFKTDFSKKESKSNNKKIQKKSIKAQDAEFSEK